ncbi:MAG: Hsp70 family protein [Acidobacteria bacterium]|nr:Hsp70 family protein [Acidobacteriota bacterium]
MVGIDLGTTNSLVAIVENGSPRVLGRGDERLVPSVVGLADDGKIIVGQAALNQYVLAPERTVKSIKRKMGSADTVQLGDRAYLPEEISAFILRYLKHLAEEVLNDQVDSAVITVPAYFNDAQRQATKRAGELAGLEVARIINEPTAAALAYGIERQQEQHLLVYDLGGGTFDVSVIEQQGDILEVRASHGNVLLGGDDFDERLLQHLLTELAKEHRYDFKADRKAMARLTRAAERVKIALSSAPYARAAEEFLTNYEGKIVHLNSEVGREEFERLIDDLLASTLDSIDQALRDAGLQPAQINRVLLVGGSTRIPAVSELINVKMGIEPSIELNPDEAVALGAAVQAAIVRGDKVNAMLIDVAPHSLGIAVAKILFGHLTEGSFKAIIPRNTTIPTTRAERFFTLTPEQDTVEIEVYQGESPICTENTAMGKFMLADIPPAEDADKLRELIVEFTYNLNGIVEVVARDRSGKRHESLTVSTTAGKRVASLPERQKHFTPELEREITQAVNSAAQIELDLQAHGKTKDAAKLNKARHTLEAAHHRGDENRARKSLEKLDDLLYDLEEREDE